MNIQSIVADIKKMVSSFGLFDIFRIWNILNLAVNTVKKIKGFVQDGELTDAEVNMSVSALKELFTEAGIVYSNQTQLGWIIRGSWAIYKIIKG